MADFVEYTEPVWRGLNMRALKVDEAYIVVKSLLNYESYLYSLSDECYTCPYNKVKAVHSQSDASIDAVKVNVAHALTFKLYSEDQGQYAYDNETALCMLERDDLQEFGVYNFTVYGNSTCSLATDKEGVNIYLPILFVFLLVVLILAIMKTWLCAWRCYHCDTGEIALPTSESFASETVANTEGQRKRMRSLDAFRGLAIVLMIFVNSGGGKYSWIEHATWNGLHLADIVFPSFLWIMGVCIPISVKSQLAQTNMKVLVYLRIIWRSIKLFFIGVCLNSINGPQLEDLRIMGVLQRFGIAYLVCGVLHTFFSKRELLEPEVLWRRSVYDLILLKGEFLVILSLIAVHLGIVFGLNVPGCPRGYLGPGGKHAFAAYPNCTGGATGFIDLQILGNAHIYQYGTAKRIYDSNAFDPEGIFGCLLTIVQVLFGLLGGVIILVHPQWHARVTRWLSWSMAFFLLGGALCTFSTENGPIPINKNLWSLSFVFVTTALAFAMLSLLYYVIDVRRWWSGFPFTEAGMNAILMYVGHTVIHKMLPWHWRIGAMNTHFVLLFEAVWNTFLWVAIALYLDHKQFYYSL